MKKRIEDYIQGRLFELQDLEYRDFHCRLMPTIATNRVIGVRMPELRKLAKELAGTQDAGDFIDILPHKYYEENNLHGFLLETIKDYQVCMTAVERFLPYIDNWATCDAVSPKVFKQHLPELLEKIKIWIKSDHTYTVRFGIEMLMSYYLDDKFRSEYLDLAAGVKSDEYYVKMMVAWFFATALAKQYKATLPYIEQYRLDKWTHNKAIQKSIESYRISDEKKTFLKSLKMK